MGREQYITVEKFTRLREGIWNSLVEIDKELQLKYKDLDEYLKDIDHTFDAEFPSIKTYGEEQYQQGNYANPLDCNDLYVSYQLKESLKMLSSFETFKESIVKNDYYANYIGKIYNNLYRADAVNLKSSDTEIPKAFFIMESLSDFDNWIEVIAEEEIEEKIEDMDSFIEEKKETAQTECTEKTVNKKKKIYEKEATSRFNEAIKTIAFNEGYLEEEIDSLHLKIDSITDKQKTINILKELNLSTAALEDPYYSLMDDVAPKDIEGITAKLGNISEPKMPEAKPAEEIQKLQAERKKEKEIAAEKAAKEKAEQERIENAFKPYDNEAKSEKAVNEGFEQYALDNSDPDNETDRFRFDDKKRIETLGKLYNLWFPGDQDMKPLIDKLQALSELNVTAYEGYDKEIGTIAELEQLVEICRSNLETQNEILHSKSVSALKIFTDKEGNKNCWPTEEDLEKNPNLKALDKTFGEQQRLIDRKLSAVESISEFLFLRKNGELDPRVKEGDHHIRVKTIDIERPSKNTDTAQKDNTIRIASGKYYDASKLPLFPHQPSPDDARQGAIGDCYFISTLSDIARHRPEKIREAMVENEDNTVTVRLYAKRMNEETKATEYYPIYVTVDKMIPIADDGRSQISVNSIWINCFEKAVAASGLVSSSRFDTDILRPIPKDTKILEEKYKEYKEYEDKGLLDADKRKAYSKEYPWLFTMDEGNIRLIKWPSLNSIVGGTGIIATELLMGPEITRTKAELETMDHGVDVHVRDRETYINLDPKTPIQLCAIILANENGALKSKEFDVPCPLDISLPDDKLFDAAFKLSGLPESEKQEQYKKFNEIVSKFNEWSKNNDSSPNRNKLFDKAYELYKPASGRIRINTLIPLAEQPYNKAQTDIYDNIEKCLKEHLPVSFATKVVKEGHTPLIPANHQYSIIGVYTDQVGRRMLRLKNPWGTSYHNGVKTTFHRDGSRSYTPITADKGEFEMELKDAMQEVEYIEYSKAKEIPKRDAPKKIAGNSINLNTTLSYTEALDKICNEYTKTERWYGGDSPEFKQLKNAVKDARQKMPLIKTKAELIDTLEGLSKEIEGYEVHCQKKKVNDDRRSTKVRATNQLKAVITAAKEEYISPDYYKKELAIDKLDKMIKAADHDLIEAAKKGNSNLLVEKLSEKMYYKRLSERAENLSLHKLINAMTQKSCEAVCEKNKALVVKVLADMDPDRMTDEALGKYRTSSFDERVRKRIEDSFRSEKSIDDAKKQMKSNEEKIYKCFSDIRKNFEEESKKSIRQV